MYPGASSGVLELPSMNRLSLLKTILVLIATLTLSASVYGVHRFRTFRPAAMTIGQRIFFFTDRPERLLVRIHERWHARQYEEIGTARYLARYATDRDFRLRMEAEAIAVEVCLLERAGGTEDAERRIADRARRLLPYVWQGALDEAGAVAYVEHAYGDGKDCEERLAAVGLRPLSPSQKMALRITRLYHQTPLGRGWKVRPELADTLRLRPDPALPDSVVIAAWRVVEGTEPGEAHRAGDGSADAGRWERILERSDDPDLVPRAVAAESTLVALATLARARAIPAAAFWDSIPPGTRAGRLPVPRLAHLSARVDEAVELAALALGQDHPEEADSVGLVLLSAGARIADDAPDALVADFGTRMEEAGLRVLARAAAARGDDDVEERLREAIGDREPLVLPEAEERPSRIAAAAARQARNATLPRALRWDAFYRAHVLATCGGVRDPRFPSAAAQDSAMTRSLARTAADSALAAAYRAWPNDDWSCTLVVENVG